MATRWNPAEFCMQCSVRQFKQVLPDDKSLRDLGLKPGDRVWRLVADRCRLHERIRHELDDGDTTSFLFVPFRLGLSSESTTTRNKQPRPVKCSKIMLC